MRANKHSRQRQKVPRLSVNARVNNNYPKVEYPGPDFLKDTSIIRNLIFTIQQVTITHVSLNANKVNSAGAKSLAAKMQGGQRKR